MDAGLAAVLGALAGSVATIGAALTAGWAQRESARITARSEHRRERREPRQAAYREFIEVISIMRALTARYRFDVSAIPPALQADEREAISIIAQQVRDGSIKVALAGPEKVTTAAILIEQKSQELSLS